MKQYKVTPEKLNEYFECRKKGYSHNRACKEIGLAVSTVRDHLKRISSEKKYEYSIISRTSGLTFIIDDKFYRYDYSSNSYLVQRALIDDLKTRKEFNMSAQEHDAVTRQGLSEDAYLMLKSSDGKIKHDSGTLTYKGKKISSSLYSALQEVLKKDPSSRSNLIKFADLVLDNPSQDVIDRLYDFIKHNSIEICKNGYVLTYKRVDHNFKDFQTRTIDNSVGRRVKMKREDVCADPDKTCAPGLHVASLDYAASFHSSGHTVKCIVHPADFVSIPRDYNGQKARVCMYKVVGIHA